MNDANRSGNPFAALASLKGEMPKPPKKKTEPLFGGGYSPDMLGKMRKTIAELYPDHPKDQRAPRELEGHALKRIGKETGNDAYVQKGRALQYGHLSPEQLLVRHPSAFLRENTIRAGLLQHPENALRGHGDDNPDSFAQKASPQRTFSLIDNGPQDGYRLPRVASDRIVDSATGKALVRKRDFNLVQDTHRPLVRELPGNETLPFGPDIQGGFLPMLQARHETLTTAPSKKNVTAFRQGRLPIDALQREAHPVFTTELTGCSIVRMGNALAHIRPDEQGDGLKLHDSFSREQSYGRRDYVGQHNAFVMLRQKPDGRTKLYFQTHGSEGSVSGSRYLEPPKR